MAHTRLTTKKVVITATVQLLLWRDEKKAKKEALNAPPEVVEQKGDESDSSRLPAKTAVDIV